MVTNFMSPIKNRMESTASEQVKTLRYINLPGYSKSEADPLIHHSKQAHSPIAVTFLTEVPSTVNNLAFTLEFIFQKYHVFI